PEGGAGDDPEAVLGEARDGEVALDPTARVQHLRVGDLPDLARDPVVAEPLEERRGSVTRDLDLRERGLVEDRRRLTTGAVLRADRRPSHAPGPASPCAQNPAATQKPRTAVGPRMNSPSGVKASGALTSRITSASPSSGTRTIAFCISSSKRSQSSGSKRPLKSAGMPSSPHG